MKSFVVELASGIFGGLEKISLFWVIRQMFPATRISHAFVDWWVLANLVLSIAVTALYSGLGLRWGEGIATLAYIYAGLRIWEVVIYQINSLLFRGYGDKSREDILRSVLLMLVNYIELIFWFALFYGSFEWAFEMGRVSFDSFFTAVHFSIVTMTGLGTTSIFPIKNVAYTLTAIEVGIGMFLALAILARFFALLISPKNEGEAGK